MTTQLPTDRRFQNLTGQRFGALEVVEYLGPRQWLCRCICGNIRPVNVSNLKSRVSDECRCGLAAKPREGNGRLVPVHGGSGTPEYYSWYSMTQRCLNPQHESYPNYGGRGIQICERWVRSFTNFLTDMGTKPTPQHTIERLDPNGNYELGNCVWATAKEQARNRPGYNRLYTFNGETKCLAAWAEERGIYYHTLWDRIRAGWSVENALTTPVAKRKDNWHAPGN